MAYDNIYNISHWLQKIVSHDTLTLPAMESEREGW